MFYFLKSTQRDKLTRLLSVMMPILCTQIAIMGMNFFDASMSGQAGDVDLAGAAIGGNIWMPTHVGINGVLWAALSLTANYLGAGEHGKITQVIRHGMFLALCFAIIIISGGCIVIPQLLAHMSLEPEVAHVATWYMAGLGVGVLPFFMITPVRSFIDTLGYTKLTMRIYLLALPINALLNYVLIFGKLGLPRLGGIGAGLASGLTYWIIFAIFLGVAWKLSPFKEYHILGWSGLHFDYLKEYLRLGVPIGVASYMEASIFGVVALFVAKFGTEIIAAHQAALNFVSMIYMMPVSFSLALTIVVGVEYGAKKYHAAWEYILVGLSLSMCAAIAYMATEYVCRDLIGHIYTQSTDVLAWVKIFLIYGIIWQAGDAIACPIQGILRGYKDVDIPFWASMLAYWGICLPLGLLLDYYFHMGAEAYWISLDVGVLASMVLLCLRLWYLQKQLGTLDKVAE